MDPRARWSRNFWYASLLLLSCGLLDIVTARSLVEDAETWNTTTTLDASIVLNSLARAVLAVGMLITIASFVTLLTAAALRWRIQRVPMRATDDFATKVNEAIDALTAAVRESGDLEAKRVAVEQKSADLKALIGVSKDQVRAIGRTFGPTAWWQWWIMFALTIGGVVLTVWQMRG